MDKRLYKWIAGVAVGCLLLSCDRIQTKKIPAAQYLHEEWKALDLSEVEVYPTLETCRELLESTKIKTCFEETVTTTFFQELDKHPFVVTEDVSGTLMVDFIVKEDGTYCIDTLKVTQEIRKEIPNLETWIHEASLKLPKAQAATKRGVPVKVRFKIPVILEVEE